MTKETSKDLRNETIQQVIHIINYFAVQCSCYENFHFTTVNSIFITKTSSC